MSYNKLIIGVLSLCLTTSLTGCTDWLDVRQKTVVEEKDQFSSYDGYQDALADCYYSLASNSLYGMTLTMMLPDVLANIYQEPDRERAPLSYYLYHHDYDQQKCKDLFDGIYTTFYTVIDRCNIILSHAESETDLSVLTEEQRQFIAGETHAVKALCHFEILRLFGPIPSEGESSDIQLPWNDVSNIKMRPVDCDYKTFVKNVREEFDKARTLLAGVDPVMTYNFDELNQYGTDKFEYVQLKDERYMVFRQFRMNYWAVRGMQARMELYLGNKAEANKIAHEILAAKTADGKPLVTLSTLTDVAANDFANPSEGLFLASTPEVLTNAGSLFGFQTKTVDVGAIQTLPENILTTVIFNQDLTSEDKRYP